MATKQPPEFIVAAQSALKNDTLRQREDYDHLKKALPAMAAKLHHAGEAVTVDRLIAEAVKGAAHLKSLATTLTQPPRPLTYVGILSTLNDLHFPWKRKMLNAVNAGDLETVKTLCDHDGADLTAEYNEAVILAAENGYLDMVKYLHQQGADITALDHHAVIAAAKNGHLQMVKHLHQQGADINQAVIYAAKGGHLDLVKYLHQQGADITVQNNQAARLATAYGHLNIVKYLHQKGADIPARDTARDNDAAISAAENGHLDMVKYLHQQGADISALNHLAVIAAAKNGHLDMVKYLHQQGADISWLDHLAVIVAAKNGHLDMVKYLHQQGADISARDHQAVIVAAKNGHLDMVKYLHQQGADISARDHQAAISAVVNGHYEVVETLLPLEAETLKLLRAESQKRLKRSRIWKDNVGIYPPPGCENFAPALFKLPGVQACFETLSKNLQKHEKHLPQLANNIAFGAAVLFQDSQTALRYLQKHGKAGKQPLHDVIQMLRLPKDGIPTKSNLEAWRGAILQHGPKMAKLFRFADKVPRPLKSHDGTNWLYYETRQEIAKVAYDNSAKAPALAELMLEYDRDNDDFEDALKYVEQYRKNYGAGTTPKGGKVPEVSFTLPNGLTYKKLADGELHGLVLGEMTDCCQSIGGAGEDCALHGYLSKDGGFYVVLDKKERIIGQSWAWLGTKNELVLDSLEGLTGRITAKDWTDLTTTFAKSIAQNAPDITALHIGTGGGTPQLAFNKATAKPKDKLEYRDSHKQYRVWKRK